MYPSNRLLTCCSSSREGGSWLCDCDVCGLTGAFGSPAGVIYALLVTIGFTAFMAFLGNELFSSVTEFAENRNDFRLFLSSMKAMLEVCVSPLCLL